MLRRNKSERDCEEDMGSECWYEDLLREASDGLDVHVGLVDRQLPVALVSFNFRLRILYIEV